MVMVRGSGASGSASRSGSAADAGAGNKQSQTAPAAVMEAAALKEAVDAKTAEAVATLQLLRPELLKDTADKSADGSDRFDEGCEDYDDDYDYDEKEGHTSGDDHGDLGDHGDRGKSNKNTDRPQGQSSADDEESSQIVGFGKKYPKETYAYAEADKHYVKWCLQNRKRLTSSAARRFHAYLAKRYELVAAKVVPANVVRSPEVGP
jgi:hypothetical protein